ncbi:DNA-3-methyladenine glycosylase 2 family protein [Microbacterium betulae]|uniref:DNA-3-methyladenine glycosylase 2 family protein n=1 Tax=Microbacterium betulae TaxID=2981139 RepID=A0AA97FII2_9MICO|nr:DNA-3-methyladenine glycosylase 2 family protein [Microbacterium sp. AB]WOF23548.1 DNA-3-methyladenine glycosylase 2 family protein [Microbacterium sp. AB]
MISPAAAQARHGARGRDPRPDPGPRLETSYRPRHTLDLVATLSGFQRGAGDPAQTADRGVIWRATRTPAGVACTALRQSADGTVRAAAWGPGRQWAIAQVPALCGARDDDTGFAPSLHPVVSQAHHRHPGARLGRSDLVFDALAQSITEQKVTLRQAFGAWRSLVTWFGERAPGPAPRPLFAPPAVDGWRRIPSWAWHRAGLEPPQSRAIVEAARRGAALVRAVESAVDGDARDRPLTSIRGIGVWTAAETRIRALGDPDAVSVGDVHLAHRVGYTLTGHRTDDDGMLELLEPWRGHRQRVIRLLLASGAGEPRRGPRVHIEDHRAR